MTELSILRALESTNAVNRVLGEAMGEALAALDQIKDSLGTLLTRSGNQSLQIEQLQQAAGTTSRLLELYRGDLETSSRSTREQLTIVRASVEHISAHGCSVKCPPPDTLPPSEEPTDPGIPVNHHQHLAAVR
jgi:hypothetical protein